MTGGATPIIPTTPKKKILDILLDTGIIGEGFTGEVRVVLQDGGIRRIEKTETIK